MASQILLEIVTPERLVLSKNVDEVRAVGVEGAFGVLPRHAPLLTALMIDQLRWLVDGNEEKAAISDGFIEVTPEKVSVLAETAELASEIDTARSEQARERAMKRLDEVKVGDSEIDQVRAERALRRSLARLKALR